MDSTKNYFDHWDQKFRARDWGKYPSEELVKFICRAFPDREKRSYKILSNRRQTVHLHARSTDRCSVQDRHEVRLHMCMKEGFSTRRAHESLAYEVPLLQKEVFLRSINGHQVRAPRDGAAEYSHLIHHPCRRHHARRQRRAHAVLPANVLDRRSRGGH